MIRSLSPKDQNEYKSILMTEQQLATRSGAPLSNKESIMREATIGELSNITSILPQVDADSKRENRPMNLLYSNKILQ